MKRSIEVEGCCFLSVAAAMVATAAPRLCPVMMMRKDGLAACADATAVRTAVEDSFHAARKPECAAQPVTRSQAVWAKLRLVIG